MTMLSGIIVYNDAVDQLVKVQLNIPIPDNSVVEINSLVLNLESLGTGTAISKGINFGIIAEGDSSLTTLGLADTINNRKIMKVETAMGDMKTGVKGNAFLLFEDNNHSLDPWVIVGSRSAKVGADSYNIRYDVDYNIVKFTSKIGVELSQR